MSEVEIQTPRGIKLSGTFVNPVDARDAAVVFSHSFLCDRTSSPHFEALASAYRKLGYATLIFDYSGHGHSDDAPITADFRTEDLRAVSGWLAERGFGRQLIHAHSSGAISAFRSKPAAVRAILATSGVLGPITYDWESIFSSEQLDHLDRHGYMEIPDDSPGPRESFRINSQTLIDLSLTQAERLVTDLEAPTMLVYDRADAEQGLVETGREAFSLLPRGSRLEVVDTAAFSDGGDLDRLIEIATGWASLWLPLERKNSVGQA